jgi:5-hydroxyisourate hydrolase
MKSPITTHVLDTSRGCAAEGIRVTLEKKSKPSVWRKLGEDTTDADGRCNKLVTPRTRLSKGIYRLTFETARYFGSKRVQSFYPYVIVSFTVRSVGAHYHVPLLLSPFGYSTYRGT